MDRVDRVRLVESGGARDDSPSWNLGRVKQGDTIRVDGASPRGSRARGQAANESAEVRKTKDIIDEFQVSSKTTDNCVEPTISQGVAVKRKLSQSEVDRMVQEAENSRDEDEVNESKHENESGLENFRDIV